MGVEQKATKTVHTMGTTSQATSKYPYLWRWQPEADYDKHSVGTYTDNEFEVDFLHGRFIDLNQRLWFLTKWRGFDKDSSSWEPIENLIKNAGLIVFDYIDNQCPDMFSR